MSRAQIHSSRKIRFSIPKLLVSLFAIAGTSSALVIDPRPNGILSQRSNDHLVDRTGDLQLNLRAEHADASSTTSLSRSSKTASPTATSASTSSTSPSSTTGSAATSSSSEAAYTGLPQPFDQPLGSNFTTTTCPALFRTIIGDQNVKNCVPISLLIEGSLSFFHVEGSETALDKTLDISCNVISATCNDLFQGYAYQVAASTGCSQELQEQNQRVQLLYDGLLSYLPVYSAACLKVSGTNVSTTDDNDDYCFASAVDNVDNPADLALFTLPLGLPLSNSSTPTCSSCTQKTMQIYAEAARNLTSPLSQVYIAAASQVNGACGANFVNSTFSPIPGSSSTSSASLSSTGSSLLILTTVVGALMLL